MCCSCVLYNYNIVMKTSKEGRQIGGERRSNLCTVQETEKEEEEEKEDDRMTEFKIGP